MEDLLRKYTNNELTLEELIRLRTELNASSNSDIEARMRQDWVMQEGETAEGSNQHLEIIRKKLAEELRPVKTKKQTVWMQVLRVAAIFLVPLLMATTVYFYQSSQVIAPHDMVVSAGKGERVSIVLPDGTKVRINALSTLSYDPVQFNKKERSIRFQGEGFFEVARNEDAPFKVSTSGMDLKVLGTVFNLQARDFEDNIEVSLISGHVMLWSPVSHKEQELFNNQKAVLCKGTGEFTIEYGLEQQKIPWLADEMVFKNRTFKEVIKTIETNYNVKFNFVGGRAIGQDKFTGTLPTRDILQTLEIIERSYGFRCELSDSVITVSNIQPAL